MDRRDFMKSAAMTAATAALVADPALAQIRRSRDAAPTAVPRDALTWNKAPCRFCGTGCHVQVGVQDGRVVAVQGDAQAAVNRGLLCVKGYHVGLALYGPDRLTRPMLRRGDDFVPISWDQAIDVVAERIERNPAGFGFYGSGQWTIPEGYAALKMVKAGLGTNNVEANARLCMSSAVTGFLAVYGVDEPAGCYDDFDRADVVVLWGNNPAEMHPVLFSRIVDRRSRGESVQIIDIGTRRTRSTAFAQHYLEFKPQTDLAIANGVMHLLLRDGTYDRTFVERYAAFRAPEEESPTLQGRAIDFEAFRRSLEEYTPERVQEISGVPAEQIRMLARLFGNRDLRITSLWCMGMNQHTRGTAINSLVHSLHLLSGHFGRQGDAPTSLTGQPSACGTVREVGTLGHLLPGGRSVANDEHRQQAEDLWSVPRGRLSSQIGPHTIEMFRRFNTPTSEGGDIDTIWVQVTNPGQTMPNSRALFDRARGLGDKFLIVSDVYPTLTTRAADLILPSAMWVEKNGMFGNSERRTQQWFKMVEPPGEARDDAWQTIAVARRLFDRGHAGMRDREGRFLFHTEDAQGREVPIHDFRHYYDVNVDERLFEEYRAFTRLKHKDLAPYQEYVRARGLRWPVVERDGAWHETRYRFVEGEDSYVREGAGIQFYHSVSHDDRAQIWAHPYTPPPESPDDEYPFWLCTGRVLEHWHSGTMTMRIPPLRRAMPQAYVEMSRDDARRLGVADGEVVRVESRRGSVDIPVWIEGRGRPPAGTLFVPFFDERLRINEVTLEAHDPFSKQPDYKKCAVRVRRIPGATSGRVGGATP